MYSKDDLIALRNFYSRQLLADTIPFWFPRSYDKEHGGFLLMRDADGSLIDDDKAVWIQGRATWLLSTLYNTVEKKQEWLDGASLGYRFLHEHCFDADGQMFFHVTREGLPIRKRRYFFSETFAVIAMAAYAKASGDESAAAKGREIFGNCIDYSTGAKTLSPKFFNTRPSKGIGIPMIMMNTAQQLRETIGDSRCDEWISRWISDIEKNFVRDDIRCVMEQVATDGSIIDHIDGRTLNPGHAIEGAWFILHEAKYRNNDPHLVDLGCRMLDYMWERGWDKEHGGILYFRDVSGDIPGFDPAIERFPLLHNAATHIFFVAGSYRIAGSPIPLFSWGAPMSMIFCIAAHVLPLSVLRLMPTSIFSGRSFELL